MNSITNENPIVEEYEFNEQLIEKMKWITRINVRIHKYKYSYKCMYTQL